MSFIDNKLNLILFGNLFLLALSNAFKRCTHMLSNFGGGEGFFKKMEIYFKGAELTIIILKIIYSLVVSIVF
jgi:hypothetical protein